MKRKLLSFLCILLSIVFLGTACTKNDVSTPSGGISDSIDTGSDSGEDTNESEYDLVRGEGQKKLTILSLQILLRLVVRLLKTIYLLHCHHFPLPF